ncbi:hypothetical protein D0T49_03465 [Paludibacter sp. 221]|uniref:hypothetical protein n=1 Tax=Paludibacter sp. 221 TaxID=2302939 RepID=UPI0013D43C4B|nr:hypothetical protein [Paludibacter sp. 221]NDV46099.1 hypothetical protein [Paludibacter sp. 221]
MKNTTERDTYILYLWENKKLNFDEIAQQKLPSFLSLKRIRNIVYNGKSNLKLEHSKEIYKVFKLKFLEIKDVNKAIYYTFNNQPEYCLHEKTIRRIINKQLKLRANNDNSH